MYNLTSEFNNTIANVQEDILQKMGTYSIYYVGRFGPEQIHSI